jgi:hypothetical protein
MHHSASASLLITNASLLLSAGSVLLPVFVLLLVLLVLMLLLVLPVVGTTGGRCAARRADATTYISETPSPS